MYAQLEKPKENKGRGVTNSVGQKKSNGKPKFNGVKSTVDPWKIKCYMLQHVTST